MKIVLFLFGFLVQLISVFGQPYKSIFSNDTTRWNVYECAPDAGGTIVYYSYSDTLINHKLYRKIYRDFIRSLNQKLGLYPYVCGYVYEDTILGKYWFLKFNMDEYKEALFMDLSLNKGDSFAIIRDFRYMWVDSVVVDSAYIKNGQKIVSINLTHYDCYDENKVKFIEGIGSTNGFYMGERYEEPDPYTLLCKYEDGIQVYSIDSEWYTGCYREGGASIENNELSELIQLYPNPSNGRIYIAVSNLNTKLNYFIYNSIGSLVRKGQLTDNMTEINLKTNGLFFIQIIDKKFSVIKKLLIYGC